MRKYPAGRGASHRREQVERRLGALDDLTLFELELEPEVEQEKHHAEVAEQTDRLELLHEAEAPGPDRHAADQEAEHRAEPQPLEQDGEGHEHR